MALLKISILPQYNVFFSSVWYNSFFHQKEEAYMSEHNSLLQAVRVWDLPTRLFHWILVALMIAQWLTAESDGALQYHVWGGYAVLTLVLFR